MKKHILTVIFIVGFLLCIYPIASSFINELGQRNFIGTYESNIKEHKDELLKEIEKAKKYNEALYKSEDIVLDDTSILSSESYNNICDITGTGIMGNIEIPKIDLKLPIYHGTSNEALAGGAGHMEGSSFPVGGINTHSIITGHRGLPNATLFLRLDELVKDDLFYINLGDRTLYYKVNDIFVVEPEDMEKLKIEDGKDKVSLVTCTPYGINTHRLIITGERTEDIKKENVKIVEKVKGKLSKRKFLTNVLPFVLLFVGIIKMEVSRIRKRSEKYKEI